MDHRNDLRVKVSDWENHERDHDYTRYIFEISVGRSKWTVKKRYSECRSLYKTLGESVPFPSKKIGPLTDKQLKKRCLAIHAYVQGVLRVVPPDGMAQQQTLLRFLEVETHVNSSLEGSTVHSASVPVDQASVSYQDQHLKGYPTISPDHAQQNQNNVMEELLLNTWPWGTIAMLSSSLVVALGLLPDQLSVIISCFLLGFSSALICMKKTVATNYIYATPVEHAGRLNTPHNHSDEPAHELGASNAPTLETYARELSDALKSLIAIAENPQAEGYTHYKHTQAVDIYLKKSDSGHTFSMGQGRIEAPLHVVYHTLNNFRHTYDKNLKAVKDIEDLDSSALMPMLQLKSAGDGWDQAYVMQAGVNLAEFKPVSITSARDTCLVSAKVRNPSTNCVCSASRSVIHPKCPEQSPKYVRAHVFCGGYHLAPAKDNPKHTIHTTLTAMDPNGSIPQFVVNIVAPGRAMAVARVRDITMDLPKPWPEAATEFQPPVAKFAEVGVHKGKEGVHKGTDSDQEAKEKLRLSEAADEK